MPRRTTRSSNCLRPSSVSFMMSTLWLVAVLLAAPQVQEEGERLLEKAERAITADPFLKVNVRLELSTFQVLKEPVDGARVMNRMAGGTFEFRPGNRFRIDGSFPLGDFVKPDEGQTHLVIESDG